MVQKIFLWTAPRCVSTAFERSVMEIEDTKIFHEPYSHSYHFGPERQSPRYLDAPIDDTASYQQINKLLSKEYDGVDYIFSKDMAYAVENHFDELLNENLRDFQHTFLIRTPRKAVVSLYKASVNKQLTGWDYFDPIEAGFKQLYELYSFVKEHLKQEPVVIDADDLLGNPANMMKDYCKATNLPYSEKILRWEPGPIPGWDVWNGWHENALKSSGLTKKDPKQLSTYENLDPYPKELQESIKESLKYYNLLESKKILPIVDQICDVANE